MITTKAAAVGVSRTTPLGRWAHPQGKRKTQRFTWSSIVVSVRELLPGPNNVLEYAEVLR